jgi:hypothetical protein
MVHCPLLAYAALVGSAAAEYREKMIHDWTVHNPHGVDVTTIHLVQSAHFDGGCKTFGCSAKLVEGEPNVCTGDKVEPYSYNILNRWFDEFFLRGAEYANASRGTAFPYRQMVQPWVASLFFECQSAGLLSWPGSGWAAEGAPLLHCPNASTLAEVRGAFQRGDLFFHAFPHNGEAGAYADAALFDAALALPQHLAKLLGLPAPTAVSQRDVPGWTRATIPLLAKRGINGLTIGAGQPPGKPDVPPIFVWKDVESGTDVVVTYESGYGAVTPDGHHESTVFVLPNGVALAPGWWGDNGGPPPPDSTQLDWASLRALFPSPTVEIKASTFDAFFVEANQPDVKAQLPVVTADIGDGWIYGVPSDPLKNTLFREAARQRAACVARGECDPTSAAMRAFDRLLVKVPEHTWGVAGQIFMPDYENYTNAQFDAARAAQQPTGFCNTTSSAEADYNTTVNSWLEQRLYVTDAPKLLATAHPALATSLESAFAALQDVRAPSTAGLDRVGGDPTKATFACGGGTTVGFDARGAITTLISRDGTGWASAANPVGLYSYRTYINEDYNLFLEDFASRVDGPGCGGYNASRPDDSDCKNFRRPNVSSAQPKRRVVVPSLKVLWHGVRGTDGADGACSFVVEMAIDAEAHALAGAPEKLAFALNVSSSGVEWDVVQLNKRATRLPEAAFFSFNPTVAAAAPAQWRLTVLGSPGVKPTDVVGTLNPTDRNASVYGGSPHLRGVEAATWTPPAAATLAAAAASSKAPLAIAITSLDVPIVCVGAATPWPSPRTAAPDMTQGVHWNIVQNLWNTNYIMWYPFTDADAAISSRFELAFADASKLVIE